MYNHKLSSLIGAVILQVILEAIECSQIQNNANFAFLGVAMSLSLLNLLILVKNETINLVIQMLINCFGVLAQQTNQFLVLHSCVGMLLFMQSHQSPWFLVIVTSSIQMSLIGFYQFHGTHAYISAAFTSLSITYLIYSQKTEIVKKRKSTLELLPLHLQGQQNSSKTIEDIPLIHNTPMIVVDQNTMELKSITNQVQQLFVQCQISEHIFLDELIIKKVDKQTQKNLNQKIKNITLRELIEKCQILYQFDSITILKTNFIDLDNHLIKIHFQNNNIIITFEDAKAFTKYIIKNSCFSLMNKLFQSFSHEFGTLLNQIALIAQIGISQFPTIDDSFDLIYNCCIIMNNMIKDLKDFHQLRSKTFQLEIVDLNIDGLLTELQTIYQKSAKSKDITLFIVNKVKGFIKQDQQRIKQILSNLIQNAIKYTESGGTIYVVAENNTQKSVKFSVLDSGIGMTEQTIKSLTQMFRNDILLTSKLSQGTAGLGLGLLNSNYLIKHLSNFQNTNKEYLQFKSTPGDGSEFWFIVWKYPVMESPQSQIDTKSIKQIEKNVYYHVKNLNLPQPPSLIQNSKSCPSQFKRVSPKKQSKQIFFPQSPDIDHQQLVIEEETHQVEEDPLPNHLPNQRARIPSYGSPICSCCKLLLVDDEIANLEPLKLIVKLLGYSSDIAHNGQQAIEMVQKKKHKHCQYSLILMDINMPIMDGIETTRRIKQSFQDITIIACSAYSDMETQYAAQMAGMTDYLEKPIKKDNLQEILETYL